MEAWINKYRPKSLKEVQGHDLALKQLKEYVSKFKKGKALLIYGSSGNGKTSAVHSLANDLGYEIIEVNASDVRNTEMLEATLGQAIKQYSLFSKGKVILVDEIDGLAGNADRGGVSTIARLIDETTFPIILTANDVYNDKISPIRKKCSIVEFKMLNATEILNQLKKICEKEKIKYNDEALNLLARKCQGDLRAAINDLQVIAESKKEITLKDMDDTSEREKKESIVNAILKILKTTDPKVALPAFEHVDEDLDKIFLWMDENIPKEYTNPEDLANAYENLSKADVFKGRIRRWQYYRYYVYIYDLLTAGIAISKKEKYNKFVQYGPTTRILKIWMANQKYLKRKAVAGKIADKTHSSSKEIIKTTLPYIEMIFKKNKKESENLIKYFDFNEEEVIWLKK